MGQRGGERKADLESLSTNLVRPWQMVAHVGRAPIEGDSAGFVSVRRREVVLAGRSDSGRVAQGRYQLLKIGVSAHPIC